MEVFNEDLQNPLAPRRQFLGGDVFDALLRIPRHGAEFVAGKKDRLAPFHAGRRESVRYLLGRASSRAHLYSALAN